MRKAGIILALTALAATAAIAQVRQQAPSSGLKGHNTNAPIDLNADRAELQDRADRAIFTGNVHVVQADMTLDTARLTVAYTNNQSGTNNGNPQIQRLDASGGVLVKSPTETAKGDFGIYDLNRKLITLIGNVQLNQQQNQANGSRLVIDLNSGRSVLDGGPPGVNSSGGRVSGHFIVPQKTQQQPQQQSKS